MEKTIPLRSQSREILAIDKMKKKASAIIWQSVIGILLVVAFAAGMFIGINAKSNNADNWSKYYLKELSNIINLGQVGDEIIIDIQKAAEIAEKNEIAPPSKIFTFDSSENNLCVELSPSIKNCYYYFNEVAIASPQISLSGEKNTLSFKLAEKNKNAE